MHWSITCSCQGIRGLLIKCPYNYQKGLVNWDKDGTFPIEKNNSIKKNYPYYYQMQLQMSVSNLSKIDFFPFSLAKGGPSSLYVQVPIANQFLHSEIRQLIFTLSFTVSVYIMKSAILS